MCGDSIVRLLGDLGLPWTPFAPEQQWVIEWLLEIVVVVVDDDDDDAVADAVVAQKSVADGVGFVVVVVVGDKAFRRVGVKRRGRHWQECDWRQDVGNNKNSTPQASTGPESKEELSRRVRFPH